MSHVNWEQTVKKTKRKATRWQKGTLQQQLGFLHFLVPAHSSHSRLNIENNVICPAQRKACFGEIKVVAHCLPYYGRKEASFVY